MEPATTAAGGTGPDLRLRLAPHAVLLHRSPVELQVGLDRAVVVGREHEPVLRSLVVGTSPAALVEVAARAGVAEHLVDELVDALDAAHLLARPPEASATTVRVVGAGPAGARAAHALAAAGFGRIYLAEPPARTPASFGSGGSGTDRRAGRGVRSRSGPERVDLLAASLRSAHHGLDVRRSRHVAHPEGDVVALTVVAADGPEPDRLVTDVLREHEAPHLLLRCAGDRAVVGPLVLPGRTPCVRCTDLARRDTDPRWPWLLEQLVRLEVPPAPVALAWTATTAATEALALVSGGRPQSRGRTVELDPGDRTLRWRRWEPHPECPCRWVGALNDTRDDTLDDTRDDTHDDTHPEAG